MQTDGFIQKTPTDGSNYLWNVLDMCCNPSSSFALIVLNSFLNGDNIAAISHATHLWKKAAVRICVDGGTNGFYSHIHKKRSKLTNKSNEAHHQNGSQEIVPKHSLSEEMIEDTNCSIPLPDFISGDFDSIDPNILEFYKNLGVTIIPTPDQDETDFTKSFLVLRDYLEREQITVNHVIALADINSDRFDHALANIHTLFKLKNILLLPTVVIGGFTLFWLLDSGEHIISIPPYLIHNEKRSWCGYASLSEPVIATTAGLKWDIEKKKVAFGDLISTSNTYSTQCEGKVAVTCSGPLLWLMGWEPPP